MARHKDPFAGIFGIFAFLLILVSGLVAKLAAPEDNQEPRRRRYNPVPPLPLANPNDLTSLKPFVFPDRPSNAELSKIRVPGGARKWDFQIMGYMHYSLSGAISRYKLHGLLEQNQYLRLIRQPNALDRNLTFLVPESGPLQGVDIGCVPPYCSADIACLLDSGAQFFVKIKRIAPPDRYSSIAALYIYARLVREPNSQQSERPRTRANRQRASRSQREQTYSSFSAQLSDRERAAAILKVSPQANAEEISIAYRNMAQLYHPDKVARLGPELQVVADQMMKEINWARDILR